MYKIISLVFLFTALASAYDITPCALGDSACYVSSVTEAVRLFAGGAPELGIESGDPMKIALIESHNKGLDLVFKDTVITGLKQTKIKEITYDEATNKQSVTLQASVELNGLYTLGGQLIVMPVEGEGKYNIKIEDIEITANLDIETITGKDGQAHWHIKDTKHTYKGITKTTFNFENLFNGNEALSKPVLEFANDNWQDVMKEFAPDVVAAIVKEVANRIDAVYKLIPINMLLKN